MVRTPIAASRSLVTGPTPHISSTGRSCRKESSVPGSTITRPSGLATCEAILARCLVRATPIEIGRPSSLRTRRRIAPRYFGGRAEQMRAAGNIGKSFVDGNALDQRGEIVEHRDDRIAEPLVVAKMAADKDQVRAELARPEARHAAGDPEGLGFVGSGQHDAAADGDGLAAQRRVEQLLDRGIEGVEVRVEDGGCRFHAAAHPRRIFVRPRVAKRSGEGDRPKGGWKGPTPGPRAQNVEYLPLPSRYARHLPRKRRRKS